MATIAEYLEGKQCAFHSKSENGSVLNVVKSQDETGEAIWIPILLDEERRCLYDEWIDRRIGVEILNSDHIFRSPDDLKNYAAQGKYTDWEEGIIQWIKDDPPVLEEPEPAYSNEMLSE